MLTYGRLAKMKAAAGEAWAEAISTYTYNGDPLLDAEIPLDSKGAMSKRHNELMLLACALGHYESNVQIEDRLDGVPAKQEAPDFFVTFSDGRIVGIEVARLTDEDRTEWDSFVGKISKALLAEFSKNAPLGERFANVSLSIQLRNGPGTTLNALVAAMVDKLLRLPEAIIRPHAIVRAAQSDELLSMHGFSLIFNERHSKWVEVSSHLPNDVVDEQQALKDLIQKKVGLTYDTQGHPLWLALAITDPFGHLSIRIQSFAEQAYAIGKFDRTIITNGSQSVITRPDKVTEHA